MVKIIKEDREQLRSKIRDRATFERDVSKALISVLQEIGRQIRIFPWKDSYYFRKDVINFIEKNGWNFSEFNEVATKYEYLFQDSTDPHKDALDSVKKKVNELLEENSSEYSDYLSSTYKKTLIKILNVYIDDLSDVLAEIINSDDVVDVFGKSKNDIVRMIKTKPDDATRFFLNFINRNKELSYTELEGEDGFSGVSNKVGVPSDVLADYDNYRLSFDRLAPYGFRNDRMPIENVAFSHRDVGIKNPLDEILVKL